MKKVIMFSAAWCGPCRMSKPVFTSLKEVKSSYEYEIVDVDENPISAANFGVSSVPTFVIMDGDKELNRVIGNVMKLKEIL